MLSIGNPMCKQYNTYKSHPNHAVERARTPRAIDRFAVVRARVVEWGGMFLNHHPSSINNTRYCIVRCVRCSLRWRPTHVDGMRIARRDDVSAPRGSVYERTQHRGSVVSCRHRAVVYILTRTQSQSQSQSRSVPFQQDAFSTTFFAGKAAARARTERNGTDDASIATERGTRSDNVG